MPSSHPAASDLPPELGITFHRHGHGADVAVYAREADAVELCLFDEGDTTGESERRIELPHRAHGTWHGHIPEMAPGQRYGYRAHGVWAPERGLFYNPAKLMLDPYGLGVDGGITWDPAVYGHTVDEHLHGDRYVPDGRDSAPFMPRSVALDRAFDWGDDAAPGVAASTSIVYEAHVRSLTKQLPGVPARLRGTYAAMGHPVVIEHLKRIGVTTVELLPIQSFLTEPRLARLGLTNYWGYNTVGFFAPHAPYAAATTPQGVLDEVKGMVKALHTADIEVLLDVVYNHTAEQGVDGPLLSFRGLAGDGYYRVDGRGQDIDVTGCGNTVDLTRTPAVRMVLDSLRYWVQDVHVDGFRFDLAVTLGRGRDDGYDPHHAFFTAMRTDPVLSRVKLIAEPWDIGMHGWRTGQFPPPFSEWNDRYRDTVRTFWLTDVAAAEAGRPGQGPGPLSAGLAGTDALFDNHDRDTNASINYVAAHDGFTLADLTAYNHKHNEANGEDNRDGTTDNHSWNHGTEGPADAETTERRARSMRNLLGTLLVSAGIPMINAGDEMGRSQGGNNNAYCQDSPVSWFDWDLEPWQEDLIDTTGFLTRLRADLPVLRQRPFFRDRPKDLRWFAVDGRPMSDERWRDGWNRSLVAYFDGEALATDSVLLSFWGDAAPGDVVLPDLRGIGSYELVWDSAWPRPQHRTRRLVPGVKYHCDGPSMQVFRALP